MGALQAAGCAGMVNVPRVVRDPLTTLQSRVAFPAVGASLALLAGLLVARSPVLLLLAAAALITGLVAVCAFRRPELALLALIGLTPLHRRLHFLGFTIEVAVAALYLFAPALLAAVLRARSGRSGMLLAAGAVIATIVTAAAPISGAFRWFAIATYWTAAVCIGRSRGPALARVVGTVLVATGAIAGIFGILQGSGIYWFVGPPYIPQRVDSTMGYYSNYANLQAAVVIVAGSSVALGLVRRRLRMLYLGAALLALHQVFAGLSRGAVVAIAAGAIVMVVHLGRTPRQLALALGATVAAAMWTYQAVPADTTHAFAARFTDPPRGDQIRQALQVAGTKLAASRPTGIGYQTFPSAVRDLGVSFSADLVHAHRLFVQLALETGWLGLVGFALLVLPILRQALSRRSGNTAASMPFVAALLGFLTQGWHDYFFMEATSVLLFGALLAGASTIAADRRPPKEPAARARTH